MSLLGKANMFAVSYNGSLSTSQNNTSYSTLVLQQVLCEAHVCTYIYIYTVAQVCAI